MLFCSAQFRSDWESSEKNLFFAKKLISKAAQRGADLIAFSEQFFTGWNPAPELNIEDISGLTITTLQKAAKENHISIIGGVREKNDNGSPFNSVVIIDSKGKIIGKYRKIHLFSPLNENLHYKSGDSLVTCEIAGIRIGIAICYDLRFGELFLAYEKTGVDLMVIPASWPADRILQWKVLIRGRAVDFGMHIAGINAIGDTPVGNYNGNSMIVSPDGTLISETFEIEDLSFTEIEKKNSTKMWHKEIVAKDRREDLYPLL